MSEIRDAKNIVSIILLLYIVLSAFFIWTIDLVLRQRTFTLLIASDLFAFSTLVYFYAAELGEQPRKIWPYLGISGLVILLISALLTYY